MSYKFGRDAEPQEALGTVDTACGEFAALGAYEVNLLDIVNGHNATAEGANIAVELLDTATGHSATAEGAAFEVSVGGSEPLGVDYETAVNGGGVSADTNRDALTGVSTGDGQNRVFHYGSALAYEETGIYVYGGAAGTTLMEVDTDYTADGDDVIFVVAPALDDIIHIYRKALGTPIYTIARAPAIPAGSTAIEVLVAKTNTPATLTLTTDYLITNGGLTVTLTAAGIDKCVTGKTVSFFYKATNDKFPLVGDAKVRLGCSANGILSVEVETVAAEVTTDYTVEGATDGVGGYIKFVTGHVPAAGSSHTVEIIRTFTNNTWLLTGPCTIHKGCSAAAGQPVVKVDGGVAKVAGVDYDYNATNKTIIFKSGKIPAGATVITVKDVWSNNKWLLTGAPTRPVGSSATGVMTVQDNTSTVDPANYTLVAGVSIVFATPPTAGHTIEAFQALINNKFFGNPAETPLADAHNSANALIVVKVDDVEKDLTTDYTASAGSIVTMNSNKIPSAATVTLFWRRLNDKYAHGGGPNSADETIAIIVGTSLVDPGDYTIVGESVIFDPGAIPTVGQVITSSIVSTAYAVVIAGGEVWLDTHRVNFPAWDYLVINGTPVVEIM
jgi:hypothetical protein